VNASVNVQCGVAELCTPAVTLLAAAAQEIKARACPKDIKRLNILQQILLFTAILCSPDKAFDQGRSQLHTYSRTVT
jgi:hypothetical protein